MLANKNGFVQIWINFKTYITTVVFIQDAATNGKNVEKILLSQEDGNSIAVLLHHNLKAQTVVKWS